MAQFPCVRSSDSEVSASIQRGDRNGLHSKVRGKTLTPTHRMTLVNIRPFQSTDHDALYQICLRTGWGGGDATEHYSDPRLLGHFYAAPYVKQDSGLCLIATLNGVPSGYILGTADSAGFRTWSETQWFPTLRERFPMPDEADTSADAVLRRRMHSGYEPPDCARDYPAHLHIDLLPNLQGRGLGAQLMGRFFDILRERNCPAAHLVVNVANTRAVAFYEKFGFHLVNSSPKHRVFGFKLS